MKRREDDKCLAKRLYARFTPYIQLGGWLVVAVPAVVAAYTLLGDAQAFNSRLNSIEAAQAQYAQKQDMINTKLDTVIQLVRRK